MNSKNTLLLFASVILLMNCACHRSNTVSDIDGNVYATVQIGQQVWMAENLRTTHFQNGNLLPFVKDNIQWRKARSGACCSYNDDTVNGRRYGLLYNWYAINDVRSIAPKGWHVPSAREVATLVASLQGDTIAAGKMKSSGKEVWLGSDTGATNECGFSALPGGYRSGKDGSFHTLGTNGYWWSATRSYEVFTWSARLYQHFADVDREPGDMNCGFAVRCVRD